LGLVPLAPLGDVPKAQLPAVIAQMKQRLDREATPSQAAQLWWAAGALMGLRYDDALIQTLLQGVTAMEESVFYQAVIRKGKIEEARKILLLQGRSRFGEPPPEAVAALDALTDVSRLEELGVRLLQATSWQELLGLNGPSPRRRGRKKTS
jgi:HEAT repeat protein